MFTGDGAGTGTGTGAGTVVPVTCQLCHPRKTNEAPYL